MTATTSATITRYIPTTVRWPIFGDFVRAAHARNIRVITELVINHTSDQHPWFQRARRAQAELGLAEVLRLVATPIRNMPGPASFFVDTETLELDVGSGRRRLLLASLLLAPAGSQFRQSARAQGRARRDALLAATRASTACGSTPCPIWSSAKAPTTKICRKRIRFSSAFAPSVDRAFPDRMLLAEANQWPEDVKEYFGDGDECHMAFHFPLMPRMYMAIAREDRFPISDIMRQTPPIPETCQWAVFLRNHDELTLEMVTDSERDYLWQTYAADRRARINLGIRRRLAPLLERDRRRIELMNSLLLSMPGTPVIYYGDEIGMGDNIHLGDRDGVRTPMQWSPDRNGGFSRADPAALGAAAHHGPALRLRLRERRGAKPRSTFAPQLDAAHAGRAQPPPSLWPR